jgi:ADP-ribose pyrophosphatase
MAARVIYEGRIVKLFVESVPLPNGRVVDLEIMRHQGAAATAAVDDAERVVLIHQYRYAAGGYIWELPAGVLQDADEPPRECAARELREEVGLEARDWRPLGTIFTTPGFCDERIHLFLARGLGRTATARDHDEVIDEVREVPIDDALAMIRRGEIVDSKTIVGLFRAADVVRGRG